MADTKQEYNAYDATIVVENNKEVRPFITAEEDSANQLADISAIILAYGGIDGAHHKTWVLDQIIRRITKDKYEDFVTFAKGYYDESTEDYEYDWDTGISP